MAQQWTERLGATGGPDAPPAEAWVFAAELTPAELRRARVWLIVAGILAIVAGALAIAVPAAASVTIAVFVGWLLIFAAVANVVDAFAMRGARSHMALRLLQAALALLAGVCILAFPLTGTLTLTFFLTAWFFASGALLLWAAFRLRGAPGWGMTALNGALSLILGILILADLPSSAAWAIGLLVGVNLLFGGVRALVAASALKRMLPEAR
jgi:uncharacterized membrane protein HdeD (DUF308 family)